MQAGDQVTAELTLSVNGNPVRLSITVPARQVKPQVMLPVIQRLANSFTVLGVAAAEATGQKISCQKGCGACCRQPVPLSELEIYYIGLIVDYLPEPRRSEVIKRFADAAA